MRNNHATHLRIGLCVAQKFMSIKKLGLMRLFYVVIC